MSFVSKSPYLIEMGKSFWYIFHFSMKYLSENVNKQMETIILYIILLSLLLTQIMSVVLTTYCLTLSVCTYITYSIHTLIFPYYFRLIILIYIITYYGKKFKLKNFVFNEYSKDD